jgi:hypothetical protein
LAADHGKLLSNPDVRPGWDRGRRAAGCDGFHPGPQSTGSRKALSLRVRLRGFRGCAHEVRRALLPDRHLFILFDLEIAFLFPWATIFRDIVATESIKLFGFIEMLIFVAILVIGYVYAWAKGALEWE